uniref:Coatomer subunit beta'-3 n=1 Tax=Zea mays TaxID=4577 RepID=A0A804NYF5_MAIZE
MDVGETALYVAAEASCEEAVSLLLLLYDLETATVCSRHNLDALHVAAKQGHTGELPFRPLLKYEEIESSKMKAMVKSFEVSELPVRSAKFISRKQWVVAGADDMFIRVYNYNTMDKVKVFEAHTDYIRCVAVNFNPKDINTFASGSLDRTTKIWSLGSPDPNFTLDGHQKGVNCVDYFTGGDRPYLITGSDDSTAKVWDYQTKSCVQTLEGHTHNISAICFHPELPIIITGSEDGLHVTGVEEQKVGVANGEAYGVF